MKKKLMFAVSLLFAYSIAYTQSPSFNWMQANTTPYEKNEVHNMYAVENGFYVINKKEVEMADPYGHYTIEYYDNNVRKYFKDADWLRQYDITPPVCINNDVLALGAMFNKDAASYDLYVKKFTPSGTVEEPVKLLGYPTPKLAKRGRFRAASSPDHKKLLILYEPDFEKGQDEKVFLTLYDDKLQKIWESEQTLPYKWERGVLNTPLVNNVGTAFIIKKIITKGFTNNYYILTYNNKDLKEYKLSVPDKNVMPEIKYKFTNTGEMIGGGYFGVSKFISTSKMPDFKGYITFKINADGHANDNAILSTNTFTETRNDLVLRNVLIQNNGIVLLGERYASKGIAPSPVTYDSKEIYITATDANGKQLYETKINREFTNVPERNTSALSFFSGLVNDKIVLMFKDYEYKYDGSNKIIYVGPPQLPVLATVDAGGKIAYKLLYNTEGTDKMYKYPQTFFNYLINTEISENTFLLRAENSRYYKMAMVKF